ncbi:MAG: response regulator [Synergistaceae bacterium]|jgi:CheY-like chemotaxis protein/nitrogen-specific signal transduction histidine kinase|nr:response regulator [Synergistaceae bacterium]
MLRQRAQTGSVTTKIRAAALLIIIALATGLMFVMGFFMNSLTNSIMLDALQPMAKTAAQSVEGNLHILAERFFMIRDNTVISSSISTTDEKREALERTLSGIEFTWIGLYESNGKLLAGSEGCPRNISGRKLFSSIKTTHNMVIEDTSIGSNGPEITMGLPVTHTEYDGEGDGQPASYLVGGYNYDVLSDILHNIKVGPNGTAFIINNQGKLIAHRDPDKVFSREAVSDSFGFGPDAEAVLLPMKQGLTGAMEISGAEGKIFVSFSPIRGTLWSLGIQAPRDDFTSAASQALSIGTVITLSSIVIFSIFMTFLIRGVLSVPLGAITDSADKLAGGEFGNLLPPEVIDRRDEIGRLGATFLAMSNSIRSLILDIGRLTLGAREGKLGERADYTEYQGDYRLILSGINSTLDVFCSHLDVMPEGLMFLDESRQVLYLNRTMNDLLERLGLDKDAPSLLSALSVASDLPPEAASLFTLRGGEANTFQTDVSIKDDDGEERNYNLSLWRVGGDSSFAKNSDGSHVCVMLILNDVTSLTKARIDAEAASRAKSDFLATMSHEIRTPLNAVIGMTSLGKSASDMERKDYCFGKIDDASAHLLGVINDILDMSKIDANKFELSSTEFDVEKMLQRVTDVIAFRTDEKRQKLSVRIDKTTPRTLVGDDQRLAQVITNLMGNAVKFTPEEGSIGLNAHLLREDDGLCVVQFEVTDTGIGISKEQQERLFHSFVQAESNTSRRFGGTGLGLAISKRIVEMMDGEIWIKSTPGKGSTFAFTIQAVRGGECASLPAGANLENIRVLTATDDSDIREYLGEILKEMGVAVRDTAGTGEEAIVLIERHGAYDICFMDWKIPGISGAELTRAIRERGANSSIVVVSSSAEWSVIADEAKSVGAERFLPKPLFPSVVADVIGECLGAKAFSENDDPSRETDVFEGYHLLLAEDVFINREIVLALLEPTLLAIDCAENGAEAVSLYSAAPEKYDMIFMDLQMPEMDGLEATRRIRALDVPMAKTVPIIAMTANVFREDVERCLAAGMNAHIGKPLDFEAVLEKLREYLPKGHENNAS